MTPSSIIATAQEQKAPPSELQQQRATRLVPQVRRLARRLARRLPRQVLLEDLEGAGSLGLAAALARGNCFSDSPRFDAFAFQHIRGAMLSELRDQDPLTRLQRRRARQVAEATRRLTDDEAGAVSVTDVARAAGLSEAQYWETLRTVQHSSAVSLQALEETCGAIGGSVEATFGPGEQSVDMQVHTARQWRRVCEAAKSLPERHRQVLELNIQHEMKLCEIARVLGVSESRISQLRSEAIRQLRQCCDTDEAGARPTDGSGPSLH